jgi:hypothetical protein
MDPLILKARVGVVGIVVIVIIAFSHTLLRSQYTPSNGLTESSYKEDYSQANEVHHTEHVGKANTFLEKFILLGAPLPHEDVSKS